MALPLGRVLPAYREHLIYARTQPYRHQQPNAYAIARCGRAMVPQLTMAIARDWSPDASHVTGGILS
jgi:hypothetical protein